MERTFKCGAVQKPYDTYDGKKNDGIEKLLHDYIDADGA